MDACFQKWKTVYRNGRVKGGQDLHTVYGRAAVMMCCRRFGAILVQLRSNWNKVGIPGENNLYAFTKENSGASLQNHVLLIGGCGSPGLTGTVTGAIPEALKSML